MKQLSDKIELVTKQVNAKCPIGVIEIIARQMIIADDANERLTSEGIVVRDIKGGVIAHPAIKIEIEATKIIAELLSKHRTLKR